MQENESDDDNVSWEGTNWEGVTENILVNEIAEQKQADNVEQIIRTDHRAQAASNAETRTNTTLNNQKEIDQESDRIAMPSEEELAMESHAIPNAANYLLSTQQEIDILVPR